MAVAVVRPMNSALLNCNRLVVTGAGLQLLTLSWSYISMVTRGGARLMSSLRPCTTTLPNTSSSSQVGDSVSSITWTRRGVKVKIAGVSWGSAGVLLVVSWSPAWCGRCRTRTAWRMDQRGRSYPVLKPMFIYFAILTMPCICILLDGRISHLNTI